jgi:hypothetical protein
VATLQNTIVWVVTPCSLSELRGFASQKTVLIKFSITDQIVWGVECSIYVCLVCGLVVTLLNSPVFMKTHSPTVSGDSHAFFLIPTLTVPKMIILRMFHATPVHPVLSACLRKCL